MTNMTDREQATRLARLLELAAARLRELPPKTYTVDWRNGREEMSGTAGFREFRSAGLAHLSVEIHWDVPND